MYDSDASRAALIQVKSTSASSDSPKSDRRAFHVDQCSTATSDKVDDEVGACVLVWANLERPQI